MPAGCAKTGPLSAGVAIGMATSRRRQSMSSICETNVSWRSAPAGGIHVVCERTGLLSAGAMTGKANRRRRNRTGSHQYPRAVRILVAFARTGVIVCWGDKQRRPVCPSVAGEPKKSQKDQFHALLCVRWPRYEELCKSPRGELRSSQR